MYNTYDIIDYNKIEPILKENEKKKIICFGAGTAGKGLMNILPEKYQISYFLDNNKKLWGSDLSGVSVKNPEELKHEDNFIVLINSRYRETIAKQLESYGLKQNIDFFNVYEAFELFFRTEKFQNRTLKFIEFLNKIPDNTFHGRLGVNSNKQKIGVVCIADIHRCAPWRDIAFFLLLAYQGYDVTLIIDDLRNFTDLYIPMSHDILKTYLEQITEILNTRFPELDIKFMKESIKADLDDEDKQELNKITNISVTWFKAQTYYKIIGEDKKSREEIFYDILQEDLPFIKGFFQSFRFDVVQVKGALAEHEALYTWMGKKDGFRVSSYDGLSGWEEGQSCVSTEGPASACFDTRKTMQNKDCFSKEEQQTIISWAKENFNIRLNSTLENPGYNFQLVNSKENLGGKYQIIMPLNLSWDGSALGMDVCFKDVKEWILETLQFILYETDATVLVREHPAQYTSEEGIQNEDFSPLVSQVAKGNPRCRFVKADEKINTYELIKACKVVLPFTTTLGVESAMLGKNVIVHTNCYYAGQSFVKTAKNKQEYFHYIEKALKEKTNLNKSQIDDAYLTYFFQINGSISTELSEAKDEWMAWTLEDMSKDKEIQKMVRAVAEEETSSSINLREKLEKHKTDMAKGEKSE